MKKQWAFLLLLTMVLFSSPVGNLIRAYYDNKIYQQYSTQYSWLTYAIYSKTKKETQRKNIPLSWMLSIYNSESRGNRYAVSVSGAIGLGQIMPDIHWKGKRPDALYDIDLNIELSTSIFRDCLNRYNWNLIRALNAYERGNKRQDVNVKYLAEIIENIYFTEK